MGIKTKTLTHTMKFTLAIAAVVAIASAGNCRNEYGVKCTPPDMKGTATLRWDTKANGRRQISKTYQRNARKVPDNSMLTVTSMVTMELEGEHQSMLTMEIAVNTTITLSRFIAKLSIACSTIASSEEISGSKN